ncbi:hypothetical protein A3780_20450 [Kosakonia radicincitans]|uniref:DUF2913 family protein n=1 Tax=Kosakonia TaxID=1330547 RepID=UPI000903FA03|nr:MULTISPECIES: DUF2913 family protein [Kosakonia]APG19817.1 hypothetical protein A3780_20450 [Kosakonia radicincitans]PTA88992.1 DUF2913 domain-containing protein [Kosakonia sp. H7A]UDJ82090.1 DUF2913 family protein [Kosakonia oryzae]
MPQKTQGEKIAHMAWCALIALHMARREKTVPGKAGETQFLIRWLSEAHRRRIFPREVADDIAWLLSEGRRHGIHAQLRKRLECLWQIFTGGLAAQSDQYRYEWMTEVMKQSGWQYRVLNEQEWREAPHFPGGRENGVAVCFQVLMGCFDAQGRQVSSLEIRIHGDRTSFLNLLKDAHWFVLTQGDRWFLSATPAPVF